jgi:DNA-binding response OmpR family regulator
MDSSFAREARRRPWGSDALLIAHSGFTSREPQVRAREAGFDFYFTKPTEPDELLHTVQDRAAMRLDG